ncbi:hypothetical protein PVAP13_1KG201010 [Panicum virgatum]|uniref:Uncharacterized protein n=1 Tax=Panicum virgatum TaxID=38727 RepID=A0A8T0XEZ3_PANVG|nr:hypothetical protein PVAP13_1KG201010 [Panicum virgatum]
MTATSAGFSDLGAGFIVASPGESKPRVEEGIEDFLMASF